MIALAAFAIFSMLALSRRTLYTPEVRLDTPAICYARGYNLAGLPENSPTPECALVSWPMVARFAAPGYRIATRIFIVAVATWLTISCASGR